MRIPKRYLFPYLALACAITGIWDAFLRETWMSHYAAQNPTPTVAAVVIATIFCCLVTAAADWFWAQHFSVRKVIGVLASLVTFAGGCWAGYALGWWWLAIFAAGFAPALIVAVLFFREETGPPPQPPPGKPVWGDPGWKNNQIN